MILQNVDIISFIADRPRPPRLLALGEPMHGSEEILRARNAVVRDLVLRGGYRSIAVESDFHRAPLVNDYIHGADIDVEHVLDEGLSHPYVHRLEAVGELVRWLREVNRTLEEPVRFYGFDGPMEMAAAPSPRDPLLRVHAALEAIAHGVPGSAGRIEELIGDEARWTEEAAMYHAERSIGGSAEVMRLRLLADDLCAAVAAASPLLAADPDRWWWLRADLRTAVGMLRYHAAMATEGPERLSRLIAQRDAMMGDHLVAIADREAVRGGTVVLAHNRHLQREASTMTMGPHELSWFGGGVQAQARLGDDYRFIAMGIGTAPGHGLAVPEPGTVEGELYRAQQSNAQLYRGADLAERLGGCATRLDRDALGAYFPLDAAHLADADGVLFLREVRA
ncbi:erythromycin esterase family protein [Tsukamurella strandjordii]|uniref:Erythromycin esterase family protein n=1 Tax=Tsukamurella strandjordii TaxID=147577 RepID=A0AA90SSW9_9ACTN|nr:erythromycin esterase family protein [Tsukamurella strandjordii]MDP0400296.1 erythromycin esterase family protein [Tsukamurella strandjordii]